MRLFNKIANFEKKALIINDMVQRIMYSLIPSVNENRVDYKALKYAVSGMNDILKFGLQACRNELKHYGQDSAQNKEKFNILTKMSSFLDEENHIDAASLAIDRFCK